MTKVQAIFWVKFVHSILFWFMTLCIGVAAWSAVTGEITFWTWGAIGIIIFEGSILIWRKWVCPLTEYAEHLGAENGSVTHLFMPMWLSDLVYPIWGAVFSLSTVTVFVRSLFF